MKQENMKGVSLIKCKSLFQGERRENTNKHIKNELRT